jgi:hypothetical protein
MTLILCPDTVYLLFYLLSIYSMIFFSFLQKKLHISLAQYIHFFLQFD